MKKQLNEIGWIGKADSSRILLFTEYRKTQGALAEVLSKDFKLKYSEKFESQPKQAISTIHGSTPGIYWTKTVEAFATGSSPNGIKIASEGINLNNECHHVIH